jgi:putative hydrolase of the HAD superfamily
MDVEETLDALRARGLSVALASNFDARLHAVCAGHPALASVEVRVISSEVGWKKPSPQFFRALVERCAVRPEQILMIGDDRENDVDAARAAGLKAVHLDRSGRGGDGSLTCLEELLG